MINHQEIDDVIGYLEAHLDEWDQETWARQTVCGTVACIAGHVCMRAGHSFVWRTYSDHDDDYDNEVSACVLTNGKEIRDQAREILGLSEGQSYALFSAINTMDNLKHIAKRLADDPTCYSGSAPRSYAEYG